MKKIKLNNQKNIFYNYKKYLPQSVKLIITEIEEETETDPVIYNSIKRVRSQMLIFESVSVIVLIIGLILIFI